MEKLPIAVLLIEDDYIDALLVRETLADLADVPVTVTHVTRLRDGLRHLREAHCDVVLLDLGLPDSQGLNTLITLREQAPWVPIVVLTGLDDERVGVSAVQQGAQDYLVKGEVDGKVLVRALRYAMERQRLEELLTHWTAEFARSNQELEEFAATISRSVKVPLRRLCRHTASLLKDYGDTLDPEGRARLKTLKHLTRGIDTLIDSLLEYARVRQIDLTLDEVDLGTVVAEVVESLAISLQEVGIEVDVATALPTVRGDQVRVGYIFRNLLINAIQCHDKPHKRVEIGYLNALPPNRHQCGDSPASRAHPSYVLYVRDHGIGIEQRYFDQLFHTFARPQARALDGGLGMGLIIVKKIVEGHGGRLWIESTPGESTTFYFTLG